MCGSEDQCHAPYPRLFDSLYALRFRAVCSPRNGLSLPAGKIASRAISRAQPKVTQTTYRSEHGADLPARVYSATQGQSRYSVTVVDYNPDRTNTHGESQVLPGGRRDHASEEAAGDEGHWKSDLRGALLYATWQLMQRDAKVTSFVWNHVDLVEGQSAAADEQRRQVPDLRGDLHARKQALHHRGNRAGGLSGAGIVSAIAGMARRERNRASLSGLLLQQLPGASRRVGPSRSGANVRAGLMRRAPAPGSERVPPR